MYQNNPGMYYGATPYYGAGYNSYITPQQAALKQPNPIGKEGYELLKSKGGGKLNFYATKEEVLREICTHRHNGEFSIVCEDPNAGIYRCNICGEVIDTKETYDPAVLTDMINYIEQAWNSLKIRNIGVISNEILGDLGKAMVLLKRFPAAVEVVNKNFVKTNQYSQGIYTGYMNNVGQIVNMITGQPGQQYVPQYQTGFGGYGYGYQMGGMMPNQQYMQSQMGGMNPFAPPMGQMQPMPSQPQPAPGYGYGYPPQPQMQPMPSQPQPVNPNFMTPPPGGYGPGQMYGPPQQAYGTVVPDGAPVADSTQQSQPNTQKTEVTKVFNA